VFPSSVLTLSPRRHGVRGPGLGLLLTSSGPEPRDAATDPAVHRSSVLCPNRKYLSCNSSSVEVEKSCPLASGLAYTFSTPAHPRTKHAHGYKSFLSPASHRCLPGRSRVGAALTVSVRPGRVSPPCTHRDGSVQRAHWGHVLASFG
jgi:hypothetical protein